MAHATKEPTSITNGQALVVGKAKDNGRHALRVYRTDSVVFNLYLHENVALAVAVVTLLQGLWLG